jgi:hypothetical protein
MSTHFRVLGSRFSVEGLAVSRACLLDAVARLPPRRHWNEKDCFPFFKEQFTDKFDDKMIFEAKILKS